MKIKDKVIVITGGTRGLGASLRMALEKSNTVIIAARTLKKDNKNFLDIQTDITREMAVKKLADKIIKKFGHIDIWINNAGAWLPHALIEDMDIKKIHKIMNINLFGTIYGSKYALISMKRQGFGCIVNILSSSALDGGVGSSGYCASKFAASGFTKSLRLEVKDFGIEVIAVYTRGIKTNFFDENKPSSYNNFMDPAYVANKIINNMEIKNTKLDLIINN